MSLLSLTLSLILILDPLGNVPIFAGILKKYDHKTQYSIILKELLISLFILILFLFFGELILIWLKISVRSVQISGGIVLFLIALGMIFPTVSTTTFIEDENETPFIVPLSVPLIAGPSILAAIMAYSRQTESHFTMLLAIGLAWLVSGAILISTPLLKKLLKDKALTACTRLMGLILTFIAVQMFIEGVQG